MNKTNAKRIWITTDWEVNAELGDTGNPGRMSSLAKYLADNGYEVTLWFTTFHHPSKTYKNGMCTTEKQVSENEKIVLLHSKVCYQKNTSPRRFIYHSLLAREMKKLIKDTNKFKVPDIIFCSYPTEQFCRLAEAYGEKNNVPVIVDARDQWPDIFSRALPPFMTNLGNRVLYPLKKRAYKAFYKADALCAMSPIMLDWSLAYAKRKQRQLDKSIFIGTAKQHLGCDVMNDALAKWNELDVTDRTWNICVFSTISKTSIDLDTVIESVVKVHNKHPEIRLIVGGKGDDEQRLRNKVANIPYILMMGWMNQVQMTSLMSISKVGMLCYRNTEDFKNGWGNKVGQYLSYDLPLLTSAEGFPKLYIEKYNCGAYYKENDTDGLSKLFNKLIEDSSLLEEMSICAKERFNTEFEYNVVMKQFEDMIENVFYNYQLKN